VLEVLYHHAKFGGARISPATGQPKTLSFLLAALREEQGAGIYLEADFEVFRPTGATRCTDGGGIWHGPPCQISPPSVQRLGYRTPKTEIFSEI